MRVLICALTVLCVSASAAAQVTVKGDAAAWREVSTAYGKLAQLRTYRMRMTAPQQPPFIVDRVNPDRSRTIMKGEGYSLETIAVGSETRTRAGESAPWQCSPMGGSAPQVRAADPQEAKGEVTVGRLPDSMVEGARTRGYRYSWAVGGQTVTQRLFVLQDSGLPRRLESLGADNSVQMTIDYYDFNAPISIELPNCS